MRRRKGLDFRKKPKKKISNVFIRELLSWIFIILISAFIGVVVTFVWGTQTVVYSNSMEPGLYAGQKVLVNKLVYSISEPKRNEVIAFLPNGNEKSHYYVKRVIGLPNETVKITDGYIYIDGVRLDEGGRYDKIADPGMLEVEVKLSDNEYIVLGDNRNFSEDSRSGNIGIVKGEYILGKVWFKFSDELDSIGFVK